MKHKVKVEGDRRFDSKKIYTGEMIDLTTWCVQDEYKQYHHLPTTHVRVIRNAK